jgi:hypothetical protein
MESPLAIATRAFSFGGRARSRIVPRVSHANSNVAESMASALARGGVRQIRKRVNNHYVVLRVMERTSGSRCPNPSCVLKGSKGSIRRLRVVRQATAFDLWATFVSGTLKWIPTSCWAVVLGWLF